MNFTPIEIIWGILMVISVILQAIPIPKTIKKISFQIALLLWGISIGFFFCKNNFHHGINILILLALLLLPIAEIIRNNFKKKE